MRKMCAKRELTFKFNIKFERWYGHDLIDDTD